MDALLQRLKTALAGRYEVERELGRGGMAVVVLGRDLRLDRRVAIKVIEQGSEHASPTERFRREIHVAAHLQHPNILPVFESGEAPGLVYYVMPYIAGASLRERLEREGPLPMMDALRIAREVALALEHAHGAGIVHRDVKPENIMLAGGVAVVADFGIARALGQAGKLTDTGMAIGTPLYMSPEQATATPQVDGRADIYALGCVLYEMLAGAPPFTAPTAKAVMARHTADPVPPLSTVRDVSPELETAVLKALAKLPADRWLSARAFADALEAAALVETRRASKARARPRPGIGVLAAVGAVVLLIAAAWLAWPQRSGAGGAEPLRSVAVLPFGMLGDTARALIADGLTEAVITGLVRVEGLRVPASSRVFAFRDPQADVRAVGRALDVGSVLSGTIQLVGERLRLTVQLVNVNDGLVLWSERFDGEMGDVFAIQDSITGKIVDALDLRVGRAHRAALARGVRTRDQKAYDLYLEARRATYELTRPGLQRAIELLEQALQRDSLFADAWVALADAWSWYYGSGGVLPVDAAAAWRRAAERGIELDSLNGFALALRGVLRSQYDWDWDGAWRDLRRAVALTPASADVALNYAAFLNFVNEPESALTHMHRAVALDPTNSLMWANLGTRFAFAGIRDSALSASEHAVELDSTQWVAYYVQMNGYLDAGRREEANRAAERYARFSGEAPSTLALIAAYYRRAGNHADVRRILDRLTVLSHREYVPPNRIGAVRLAAGDRAGALDALEESARNRDLDLFLDLVLTYSPLIGEPRFEAVRRRVYGGRPMPRNPFP